MESFTATFALSFRDYCNANNITEPSDEMIEQWKDQTVNSYQTNTHTDMVMNLFNIPKNKKKNIEYHEYTVKATGHDINAEKQVLLIFLKLKLKK